jgi:hypothetical protein
LSSWSRPRLRESVGTGRAPMLAPAQAPQRRAQHRRKVHAIRSWPARLFGRLVHRRARDG